MSGAPDMVLPVAGFRAWWPDADGTLRPFTMRRERWQPGINQARCLVDRSPGHEVPGHGCSCGLYALTSADDPRLTPATQAVGAIAAWGEMEVHSTGFRARFAAVTALCLESRAGEEHERRLRAAAARYRVPLVPRRALRAMALEHAAPLDLVQLGLTREGGPGPRLNVRPAPPLSLEGARGISVEDHVWVRIAGGELLIGITPQLARAVAAGARVSVTPSEVPLRAGSVLATIGEGDARLLVRAPCDLLVQATNPELAADPALLRADPEGRGWLLRASPPAAAWARQGGDIAWERAALTLYSSALAELADAGEDPFRWLRPSWIARLPDVRSGADVLAVLASERDRPRFAHEREVRERIGGGLRRALADPRVRRLAFRAQARVHMRLHEPDADIDVDLFEPGGAPEQELTIFTDAHTADLLLAGRIDPAQALRARRIQSPAPAARVLGLVSLLEELQRAYARERADAAARHRRPPASPPEGAGGAPAA